ncbi:glycogen synthase GlgA [Gallibacterium trehalosifermentans]|uniref:Glycogen synthase n=1 Tax=Gallibacterium trehalosifermentans TaxID=516935 RepID=A0ABV6GZ65_9PAST
MKVLHICSELYPLIKTGGLADVMGALPFAQQAEGMDVRVVLPMYPAVAEKLPQHEHSLHLFTFAGHLEIRYVEYQGIGIYLINAPHLFNRSGNPYHNEHYQDYADNYLRFATLGWVGATLAAGADRWWGEADVLHMHDWQAGLAGAYAVAWNLPVKKIFTIHNLAYAGLFDARHMAELQLPHHFFHIDGLEFYGQISYLKAGLYYADEITAVSPTYAREITDPSMAYGFDGLLQTRAAQQRLHGILNGVDDQVWNPATDPNLEKTYKIGKMQGKKKDKEALQAEFGLAQNPDAPLLVMVTRLVEQKGADLVIAAAEAMVNKGIQLAVLGAGAPHFEEALRHLAATYPSQIGVKIAYNEALSHRMVAGGDVILVPSRFEPCGLTQLYGLKYGTLPLVRATGGLADTVVDTTPDSQKAKTATGFVFLHADVNGFLYAIDKMLEIWQKPRQWSVIRSTAMQQDFSWQKAAKYYLALYQK